jgi:hypothetical protein
MVEAFDRAEAGDEAASQWIAHLSVLGKQLGVRAEV